MAHENVKNRSTHENQVHLIQLHDMNAQVFNGQCTDKW